MECMAQRDETVIPVHIVTCLAENLAGTISRAGGAAPPKSGVEGTEATTIRACKPGVAHAFTVVKMSNKATDGVPDHWEASTGNMLRPPDGIDYVIVNGVVTVEGTELTGEEAGRVIRRTWEVPGVHHGM